MSLAETFNQNSAAPPPIDRQALGHALLELAGRPMDGNSQNLNINQRAESLIRGGADIEVTDAQGRTPLLCAAKAGRLRIVDMLLAAGANIRHRDKDGLGAPDLVRKNNKKILESLGNAEQVFRMRLRQELDDVSSRRDFTPLRPLKVHKRRPRPHGQGQI
jgi:hypothetical protein